MRASAAIGQRYSGHSLCSIFKTAAGNFFAATFGTDILRFMKAALGPAPVDSAAKRVTPPGKLFERAAAVRSGIDELSARGFAPLAGRRVGLITNHTGVDSRGRPTFKLLSQAHGVNLAALFSPEHGLNGNLDEKVASTIEPKSKLPIYSLYGKTLRPTREMLQGLDALVFDIQDAGARFYTYITTMAPSDRDLRSIVRIDAEEMRHG